MEEHLLLIGLSSIIVLGIAAQWLAAKLRLPGILLLLLAGFVAGPVTGLLDPDALFGDILPTLISLAVGIILFDGGLSLRFSELREVRSTVRRLISIGAAVTLVVGTLAAHWLLAFEWRLSLLLSAILIVSGPTVILPLLRHIRPKGRTGSVLKWEGIFIDPIGAVVAVLIFEVIIAGGERQEFTLNVLTGLVGTALIGGLVGLGAAFLLVVLLRRFLIPSHLEVPVTLMFVVAAFASSNLLQPESGLLAVTIMGVGLANQRITPIRHIVEFGETVGVLLTSVLFVVLAARLELSDFAGVGGAIIGFIAILVLVARPLATVLSTVGTDMSWRERTVVAWMAPRGIVAASVASIFALRLSEANVDNAELLVPYTFATIVGTVAIYGLTAGPLARRLGVADPDPSGVLIIGAHHWARKIAAVLQESDVKVVLVPTNRAEVAAARLDGFTVHVGSVLQEEAFEQLDLDGIGQVVAMTHNEEYNALAGLRLMEVLGRQHVFQLPADREPGQEREVTHELRGRLAFGSAVTFQRLAERFREGATVKRTKLTEEFDFSDLCAQYEGEVTPLFVIRPGSMEVVSEDGLTAGPGDAVVSIVPGEDPGARASRKRESVAG